ncbi:MAG: hypothetical protein ACR2RB_23260 [Gammaproteobacteria bacterium]
MRLALNAERQAHEFYLRVLASCRDDEVLAQARELAREEREHVELVQVRLTAYPKPEQDWDEDLDPSTLPE